MLSSSENYRQYWVMAGDTSRFENQRRVPTWLIYLVLHPFLFIAISFNRKFLNYERYRLVKVWRSYHENIYQHSVCTRSEEKLRGHRNSFKERHRRSRAI